MASGRLFGDKKFYRSVFAVAMPIMLQTGITNFVNMLDNIMVGQVGTEQMSGVAIVNQLVFVYNLMIFGAISGAGIFVSQFFGLKDNNGIRYTVRFKLLLCVAITAIVIPLLAVFSDTFISLFLHSTGEGDLALTLMYGKDYLYIALFGLAPFALAHVYSGTLRETKQTIVPMIAGIAAVLVNLVFNYLLIYGKFGFPELGVKGAAIATVLSRFVELAIIMLYTHLNKARNPFIKQLYTKFRIPRELCGRIARTSLPLFANELLWSLGTTVIAQCYSVRGIYALAGYNINMTILQVFMVSFIAMGDAIAIMVGNLLGAGKLDEARRTSSRLIVISILVSAVFGALMALTAPYFPRIYNTADEVKAIATSLMFVSSAILPFMAFSHACYFTLRSGGRTLITFLFDSCTTWTLYVPLIFILSRFTDLGILYLYIACQAVEVLKCIVGFVMVRSGKWARRIVSVQEDDIEPAEAVQ